MDSSRHRVYILGTGTLVALQFQIERNAVVSSLRASYCNLHVQGDIQCMYTTEHLACTYRGTASTHRTSGVLTKQGLHDFVLTVDAVGCFGDDLTRRSFAHDVLELS